MLKRVVYTVIIPSQGRYLHTKQHKQNKRTQASMRRVGYEHTIPVFEQAETVHLLDSAATVIGMCFISKTQNVYMPSCLSDRIEQMHDVIPTGGQPNPKLFSA
jgi:hypothetical protein